MSLIISSSSLKLSVSQNLYTSLSSASHQPLISLSSASRQPLGSLSSASRQPLVSLSAASHQPLISLSSASHQSLINLSLVSASLLIMQSLPRLRSPSPQSLHSSSPTPRQPPNPFSLASRKPLASLLQERYDIASMIKLDTLNLPHICDLFTSICCHPLPSLSIPLPILPILPIPPVDISPCLMLILACD